MMKGRFVGEDFAWCDDYTKKYDKKISVWTDFDFRHGGLDGNYQHWIVNNVVKVGEGHAVPEDKTEAKAVPRKRTVNVDSKNQSAA